MVYRTTDDFPTDLPGNDHWGSLEVVTGAAGSAALVLTEVV